MRQPIGQGKTTFPKNMKKEMLMWLKQLLAENDEVERNTIKRKIITQFPKLRFVMNDKERELQSKEQLRNSMVSFCHDTNEGNRMHLMHSVANFERLFV